MSGERHVDDRGFTLVEVVVALSLLMIVSMASLTFFVGGSRAIVQQQRSLSGVTVANQAMEAAFALAPQADTASAEALLTGRTQASVTAGWATGTAAGLTGVSDTYPAWDPTATAASTPTLPVTQVQTLDNIAYTVTTLVGTCYRADGVVGASAPCVRVGATEPSTVPAGKAKMYRVMVLVTWTGAKGTCAGGTTSCSYQAQSLVDPNDDAVWNATVLPVAVADTAIVAPGASVVIDVLHNDQIGQVIANPVRDVSVLTGTGTATLNSDGTITFAAPSNAAGLMTFQYRLRDQSGHWSSFATVSVQVTPQAVADTATTMKNTPVTVAVGANDIGTIGTLTVAIAPTHGTAAVSGSSVVYTPASGYTGSDTFQYYFVDPNNLQSTQGVVTVSVTDYPTPKSSALTVDLTGNPTTRTDPIDWLTLTGNPAGYKLKVLSVSPVNGSLFGLDGSTITGGRTGTALTFSQAGNVLSVQTLTYQVLTPDGGKTSATSTITVRVQPVATANSFTLKKNSGATTLNLGSNDVPTVFDGVTSGSVTLGGFSALTGTKSTQCGSLGTVTGGSVAYTAGTYAQTCTFTYTLTSVGLTQTLIATGTATVVITN